MVSPSRGAAPLLLIALTGCLVLRASMPQTARGAAEKPVRLAWFPRFSPDGQWLVTAHGGWDPNEGGEVRVWDSESGKELFKIPADRGIRTVEWSPKGKFFAAGGYGSVVLFYDAESAKPMRELKFPTQVEVLQISPDERRLITAHGDGSVLVSELPSGKPIHSWIQIHQDGIWGMRLSPDGSTLATGGKDGFVRVYDLNALRLLHELKHPNETNGVAFTSDGKTLLTGCGDAKIRIFNAVSGKEIGSIEGHAQGSITDLQLTSDDKLLASAGFDRTVRLWDVSDLRKPKPKGKLDGHTNLVFGVAISAEDKWLASSGWDDQVIVWDLATRKQQWSWQRGKDR